MSSPVSVSTLVASLPLTQPIQTTLGVQSLSVSEANHEGLASEFIAGQASYSQFPFQKNSLFQRIENSVRALGPLGGLLLPGCDNDPSLGLGILGCIGVMLGSWALIQREEKEMKNFEENIENFGVHKRRIEGLSGISPIPLRSIARHSLHVLFS